MNGWKLKTLHVKKEQQEVQPTNQKRSMIHQDFDLRVTDVSVTRRVSSNAQTCPSQNHFLHNTDEYDTWVLVDNDKVTEIFKKYN